MNKKNYQKIAIAAVLLVIAIYFFNLFSRFFQYGNDFSRAQNEVNSLDKKIKKTVKSHEIMKNFDQDFLENAYFDQEVYFENYIRDTLKKYRLNVMQYKSEKNEKNYSDVSIKFDIYTVDLFRLLYDLEKGQKYIIVQNLSISKRSPPYLTISMRIRGHYK